MTPVQAKIIRATKAIEEYFGGDLDAFVEVASRQGVLLYVRLVGQPVRIQPVGWGEPPFRPTVADRKGFKHEILNGHYPLTAVPAYSLLVADQPTGISCVRIRKPDPVTGFVRYFDHPEFRPETDTIAWFTPDAAGNDPGSVRYGISDVWVYRSHLLKAINAYCGTDGESKSDIWPWGKYETTLLRHMAAAAERYWKNFDPADPSTANTKETVVDWLVSSRGVSRRSAEAIDTILRAENLPKGPRARLGE